MQMIMQDNWKTAPTELTVVTSRLSDDMKGQPYQAQIKQFKRAYMYGIPENCSVDWFLMILLNVGLEMEKEDECLICMFLKCYRNC